MTIIIIIIILIIIIIIIVIIIINVIIINIMVTFILVERRWSSYITHCKWQQWSKWGFWSNPMSSKSIKDVIDVGQGIHHDHHNNHEHLYLMMDKATIMIPRPMTLLKNSAFASLFSNISTWLKMMTMMMMMKMMKMMWFVYKPLKINVGRRTTVMMWFKGFLLAAFVCLFIAAQALTFFYDTEDDHW